MGSSKPAEPLVPGINLMGFWLKIVARWKRIWKTSLQDRSNTTREFFIILKMEQELHQNICAEVDWQCVDRREESVCLVEMFIVM